MKTKILISILSLGAITDSYAQKIKTENVEFAKTIQPKLLKTESPIDITLVRTTSSEELKNNNLFNTYVSVPAYITNNTSTPKYIAVLDYIFKPATNKIGKLGTMLNELYFASNTTATLYLMTKEKGVFHQEPIELISNSQDNWKTDALGFSTAFKATLSDADASKFLLNGQFRPEIIFEIQKKQIERLTVKAFQTIRDNMAENISKNLLIEDILWYMMNIKNNVKPISSKSKNVLSPFITYAEKLNAEYETNKLFKFGDERIYKLTKAREYIFTKYKLDDFFQLIPAVESAVNIYFENKDPQKTDAFKNAADINSIIQIRKIVNDSFYETQRKEKENQLDRYIKAGQIFPPLKMKYIMSLKTRYQF